MPGIFDIPQKSKVVDSLVRRMSERLDATPDRAIYGALAEAVWLERRRFAQGDAPGPGESEAIEAIARALHSDRGDQIRAALALTRVYAGEIHNRFSPRTYQFATRVLPRTLTTLLTATRPRDLASLHADPLSRILVQGPLDTLRGLSERYTFIVAPTHLSNLDSPLLGYALYAAGLPPVVYGAGLNLFSNPAMAFFMSRLGAYTVDRRKRHALYKDVLKDYSVDTLARRCHSLFFPGGTRSRSGRIERKIKKGLLGTGLAAWQEGLAQQKPNPEVLIVPCTLSCSLVLEAETLIQDSLAEEGRHRYIISDDEFSDNRKVASFVARLLSLDASVIVRFGDPMDVLGNPVNAQGQSLDPKGEPVDRAAYITDREGRVVTDPQRDRVYTEALASNLERAFSRDNTALSTHVASFAAWQLLAAEHPRLDLYQRAALTPAECRLPLRALLTAVERVRTGVTAEVAEGRLHMALPADADAILEEALGRFASFHSRPALARVGSDGIAVDPKLALYYSNRLLGYGLESRVAEGGGRR